ncbi:pyrroloquinoline-quinone synthase [Citreimonas salinaria]|uniref:Pyrroloquinoline-quinone synthase n=1 Tax=Citreimonas salinaria TaxID=321339 RepID=A0A1H3FHJ6_9RHOB|nr:pyrroloquinoline-quinone synthase [Citreimonas salinaria]
MSPQRTPQSRDEFEARLRRIGAERYHDLHPFHDRLHGGGCTPDEVRAWVINRYYYQHSIPKKDAAFMSRVDDPALRRAWRSRIEDHDGTDENEGGIRRWLRLAEAVGLDPDYVASCDGVLPTTRFAVDAYVRYVREKTLLEAVASSLTELFAPKIHANRIEGCCGIMPSPMTARCLTSATG